MRKYNERHRNIVETFLDEKFCNCNLKIDGHVHTHSDGFYIKFSAYSLCDIIILNTYRTSEKDEAIFDKKFLWNFGKWFGFKYKRDYLKDWFLKKYLKNFDLSDKIYV